MDRKNYSEFKWRSVLMLVLLANTPVMADTKPLPKSQWPRTVSEAVPLVIRSMNPTQQSIVSNTSLENLPMLQGEWGEDIAQLLGIDKGNRALIEAACGISCTPAKVTAVLMQATWKALTQ